MQEALLIQFAKEPVPGQVKTRMLPALSPEQAVHLHCDLVHWTAQVLTGAGVGAVELAVAGSTRSPLFEQCRTLGVEAIRPQRGSGLGHRMCNALEEGLSRYAKVILVGSDCPQIDSAYLEQAAALLDANDVVLGPAEDGGYVLIGVTDLDWRWFDGVHWGTDTVYADTVTRLEATETSWSALPVLQDIDRPEDLRLWRTIAGG
ncbi:glycosyltransferase [Halioglobus maricola]|uniref:Glycosyltransferase n=1 Tax=Halioglobus maricola TaxID=2601894 RepID=A0A5P9NKU7_9GAMM|nr:TIGR04282 family arsenosugar biosynthesis glycosyltransferase [Halioglobus maricola]QFU76229.1 glycosyltransferase [Halioglobus maricola]